MRFAPIFALVLLTGPALGQAALPAFEEADLDGDGHITSGEAFAVLSDRFNAVDTDRNGLISLSEMVAAGVPEALARARISVMDSNHDGEVDLREMGFDVPLMIGMADRNQSGGLDRAEYEAGLRLLQKMK